MSEPSTEPGEIGDVKTDSAAQDAFFDALADKERRTAIEYLAMETGAVPVDNLVDVVAARSDSDEGPSQRREQTKIDFYHVHLPNMETAGLINYNQAEQLVEPTETVDVARQLIDQVTDTEN